MKWVLIGSIVVTFLLNCYVLFVLHRLRKVLVTWAWFFIFGGIVVWSLLIAVNLSTIVAGMLIDIRPWLGTIRFVLAVLVIGLSGCLAIGFTILKRDTSRVFESKLFRGSLPAVPPKDIQ